MKTFSILAIAALVLAATPRGAHAQRATETYYACYAPPSGVVYRIRTAGAPSACVEADHVEFSWTSRSVAPGGNEPALDSPARGGGGGGGGAPTVPAGAIVFFQAASCPSGWTPFDAARGRAIVAVAQGGTIGGTVGAPLADLEDRLHTHTLASLELQSTTRGAHAHDTDGGTFVTTGNGSHSHVWATKSAADVWRDGTGQLLVDWQNGMDSEGEGQFPISTGNGGSLTLHTSAGGVHSHQVTVPQRSSTENGDHQHTTVVPERASTAAGTADVTPYVQLLACRKS